MANYRSMKHSPAEWRQGLKKLRERKGLTVPRDDVPLEVFGVESFEELVTLIRKAAQFALLHDFYKNEYGIAALLNAYGLEPESSASSVIERRKEYAERMGVSVRTVERREEEGITAVFDILTVMIGTRFTHWVEHFIDGYQEVLDWWNEVGLAQAQKRFDALS